MGVRARSAAGFLKIIVLVGLVASSCVAKSAPGTEGSIPAPGRAATPPISCPAAGISGAIDGPVAGTELVGQRSAVIPNGDFADGLQGWVISDPATARLEPSDRGIGDNLRVHAPATRKLRFVNTPRFAVTPGAGYDLVVGAALAAGSTELASFSLVFLSSGEVSRKLSRFEPPNGPPRYLDYTIAGVVPYDASQAIVQITYDQHDGAADLSVYGVNYAETGTIEVRGWAFNRGSLSPGAPSTGIESISLYLDGPPSTGTFIGAGILGDRRDDVAEACGDARFASSGWHFRWSVQFLTAGTHTLYALIAADNGTNSQVTTKFVKARAFPDDPIGGIDVPVAGTSLASVSTISGWAIDRNSTSDVGVDTVRLYVDGGASSGTLIGTATSGQARPGVALHFGDARFSRSGWSFEWDTSTVPDGSHDLSLVFHSSTTGASTTLTRKVVVGGGREISSGKPTRASNALPQSPARMAVDGLPATSWNSGRFAPQWIEVDLEATVPVERLRLVVTQSPSPAFTKHRVYGRGPTGDEFLLHEFSGITAEGQTLEYSPPAPWTGIRFVRVETIESPSWIGWHAIGVFLAGSTPTGTLQGLVRSLDAPVAGAQLELRAGGNVLQSVFTDGAGAYAFVGIPPGTYTVRAYGPSGAFARRAEAAAQTLEAGATLRVDTLLLDPR